MSVKLTGSVFATGTIVPSDNDKSNDGFVALLDIEYNHTIPDGAKQNFNTPYLGLKPIPFALQPKTNNKIFPNAQIID